LFPPYRGLGGFGYTTILALEQSFGIRDGAANSPQKIGVKNCEAGVTLNLLTLPKLTSLTASAD
jgi:hypothetical protein